MQFKVSGLGSYSLWENILLEFFDFIVFVILLDRFIRDIPLPALDLFEDCPFFYPNFFILPYFVTDDFIDLDAWDFFPLVLRLKTVPFSSSNYPSSSSSPNYISISWSDANNKFSITVCTFYPPTLNCH